MTLRDQLGERGHGPKWEGELARAAALQQAWKGLRGRIQDTARGARDKPAADTKAAVAGALLL